MEVGKMGARKMVVGKMGVGKMGARKMGVGYFKPPETIKYSVQKFDWHAPKDGFLMQVPVWNTFKGDFLMQCVLIGGYFMQGFAWKMLLYDLECIMF